MAIDNHFKTVALQDAQTKRVVYTSALTNLSLAGSMAFQHPDHTTVSPLVLSDGVETRLTFPTRDLVTFSMFEHEPRIGSALYPIWDFDNSVVRSYPENRFNDYKIRLQCTARSVTSGTGHSLESILRIPSDIAIQRRVYTMVKGVNPQRADLNLEFYVDEVSETDGLEIYLEANDRDWET